MCNLVANSLICTTEHSLDSIAWVEFVMLDSAIQGSSGNGSVVTVPLLKCPCVFLHLTGCRFIALRWALLQDSHSGITVSVIRAHKYVLNQTPICLFIFYFYLLNRLL